MRKPGIGYAKGLVVLSLLILTSAVAVREGALPGDGLGRAGMLAQVALWAGLLGVLRAMYRKAGGALDRPGDGGDRVGIALILSIGSLFVLRTIAPDSWAGLYYFRYLVIPCAVVFWLTVLLAHRNNDVMEYVIGNKILNTLVVLSSLLFLSFVWVSLSDVLLAITGSSGEGAGATVLRKPAWVTNALVLFAAYALVFAASSRIVAAILWVTPIYLVLNLANFAKTKYMHQPVVPLDLVNLPEFLPLFKGFFGPWVFAATMASAVAWVLFLVSSWKRGSDRYPIGVRASVLVVSAMLLAAVPVLYAWPDYDMEPYFRKIGGPEFHKDDDFQKQSGILLTWLAEIPSSFVETPENYSRDNVRRAASAGYGRPRVLPVSRDGGKPNLVVLMVESFMDPMDLGYRFSSDPIPSYRALREKHGGGHVIVPGAFGGSINSEFELLTGMSTLFLPERSVPYRQYIKGPTPSLPRALKNAGYRTIAIQADPKTWFHRAEVYDLLGFDETHFLHEDPDVERCRRGWWPSDMAVMDRIKRASRGKKPFFVFAFPSSTHARYNTGVYRDSDLKVEGTATEDIAGEVQEYANALRDTDRAIAEIVRYFARRREPTMVVVIGDHLPPFSGTVLRPFYEKLSRLPDHEREWMVRRVPMLVATNYKAPGENTELSLNVLPSYLLERMGIPSSGFIRAGDVLRGRIPVYSKYVKGSSGGIWRRTEIPAEERSFVDNYRILQYDTLLGNRHSLEPGIP